MTKISQSVLITLLFVASTLVVRPLLADEPTFLVEAIEIEGARRASPEVLVGQTLLEPGVAYRESEILQAAFRLRRLPFIYEARPHLEKGSERDRFVLVFTVEETTTFFLSRTLTATWGEGSGYGGDPDLVGDLVLGVRAFPGDRNLVFLAADADRGLSLGWTRYSLFGSSAYGTLVLRKSVFGDSIDLFRDDARFFDEETEPRRIFVDEFLELNASVAIPLRGSHQLVGEVEAIEGDSLFFGDLERGDQSLLRLDFRWLFDQTDDPLLPRRGRRFAAGVRWADFEADYATLGPEGWTVEPLTREGWGIYGELARHLQLSARDTLSALGGATWSQRDQSYLGRGSDSDRLEGRAELRWSRELLGEGQSRDVGSLRFELSAIGTWAEYREDGGGPASLDEWELRAALAFRTRWGLVRLGVGYAE